MRIGPSQAPSYQPRRGFFISQREEVEAMDRESNMGEEDMEMRNFFKSTRKIHPSLKRAPG
jgi:hypothetical protein